MSKIITNIPSWDLLMLVFLILVSIGYAFLFVNRGKLIPILVSTYMAFVLVELAPFFSVESFLPRLLAFAVIFLVILFVLSRVVFQSPVGSETLGVLPSFLLALAQTGFLLAAVVSFLPRDITREFSGLTRMIFVGNTALFYWAAVPVVLLVILGYRANREVG